MSPGARLAAFGVVLAATFGGGAALGAAVGPWEDGDPPAHHDDAPSPGGAHEPGAPTSDATVPDAPAPDAHEGHGTTPTTVGGPGGD